MKFTDLNRISKLFFGTIDIAKELSITQESARITAVRYTKKKLLIRLKRDLYILPSRFDKLKEEEIFHVANILQTPSYISLTTALSYYNITTQQQRNYIESIGLKRTRTFEINQLNFSFSLIKKSLYTGFGLNDNYFIATPEKALADSIYLSSLKKYNCDFNAINFSKIKLKTVNEYLLKTNSHVLSYWKNICRTYKIWKH
ncbi:MAG: hypothetical protein C4539_13480 [Ignavibacteriales bacterium]|nr:MAG: hypothetical protein C4539_13480 [Ignavibacteriales bacterium]